MPSSRSVDACLFDLLLLPQLIPILAIYLTCSMWKFFAVTCDICQTERNREDFFNMCYLIKSGSTTCPGITQVSYARVLPVLSLYTSATKLKAMNTVHGRRATPLRFRRSKLSVTSPDSFHCICMFQQLQVRENALAKFM